MQVQSEYQQKSIKTKRFTMFLVILGALLIATGIVFLNKPRSIRLQYLTPTRITLNPIQHYGQPIEEDEIAEFLAAEKESAVYLFLNESDHPIYRGIHAEDLHFSKGFHYVIVGEDGNSLYEDSITYLVLYERTVVGKIKISRKDGRFISTICEYSKSDHALTELLCQYFGEELAMICIGPLYEIAVTPDGVLHPLDTPFQGGLPDGIPSQNSEYYKLFHLEDNCIKGID